MVYLCGAGRLNRSFVTVEYREKQRLHSAQLTVERRRRAGFGRPLHDCTAADVLELWRDHQAELRQYLFPLLADLTHENLLRPRAGDVYRAFASIPADPKALEQLGAILPGLEADSPGEREAASKKIEALGPRGILAAVRFDRAALSPEQGARLDTLIERHSTLSNPANWRKDYNFLVDCLQNSDPEVRRAALENLRTVAGHDLSSDIDAAEDARATASAELRRDLAEALSNTPPPMPDDDDAQPAAGK